MKSQSGHLHHVPNLYVWYHGRSSSGSPDILFAMLLYYTKCQSRKREIIQPNIYRILPKLYQDIYTLDKIYMPNIMMILAHAVPQIFCSQGSIGLQKGHNSAMTSPTEKKNIRFRLFFMFIPYIKFQDPISKGSWPYPSVTNGQTNGRRTDRRTGPNQYAP